LKKIALIAALGVVLTPCLAQAAGACDGFKNVTYAGVIRGKFDNFPDAFGAMSLRFDANGVGAGRGLIGVDPASTAAVQTPYAGVSCQPDADGKSGLLNFGPSLGSSSFTIFDGGSRIWTRHEVRGRPVAGWLFRQPPAPIATPTK
jgi:hypothetical protein